MASGLRTRAFSLGVSQAELARRLGTARRYVSNVLNGHATSAPLLDRIERELDRIERERASR